MNVIIRIIFPPLQVQLIRPPNNCSGKTSDFSCQTFPDISMFFVNFLILSEAIAFPLLFLSLNVDLAWSSDVTRVIFPPRQPHSASATSLVTLTPNLNPPCCLFSTWCVFGFELEAEIESHWVCLTSVGEEGGVFKFRRCFCFLRPSFYFVVTH